MEQLPFTARFAHRAANSAPFSNVANTPSFVSSLRSPSLASPVAEPRYIPAANQYALHSIGGLMPLEWVRRNADVLGRHSRRVQFTSAAFERSLAERPQLASSFGSEEPHQPTPANMAFGVAANVTDLETGQDLLDALSSQNVTVNIRLRWDKEISNLDVREMFEKVKAATGRRPEDMDIYVTTPGAGSYGWHVGES